VPPAHWRPVSRLLLRQEGEDRCRVDSEDQEESNENEEQRPEGGRDFEDNRTFGGLFGRRHPKYGPHNLEVKIKPAADRTQPNPDEPKLPGRHGRFEDKIFSKESGFRLVNVAMRATFLYCSNNYQSDLHL
jgi:hypothetical protein